MFKVYLSINKKKKKKGFDPCVLYGIKMGAGQFQMNVTKDTEDVITVLR